MNQNGALNREEPYSFFGPVVSVNQAVATYGSLAGTKPMDAFLCTTTSTGAATLTDQNGAAVAFVAGSFIIGNIYQLSPSSFTAVGGGVYVPLYK